MKPPFGSLTTIEVAELHKSEVAYYAKELQSETEVLKEIADCQKRLDQMGIKYANNL